MGCGDTTGTFPSRGRRLLREQSQALQHREWNEGEPGGASGNASHQQEKQQDPVSVGPCGLHLWRTPKSNQKGPGGSPELPMLHPGIGYRRPLVPSHLDHPRSRLEEDPGTTSPTLLHHKAPTDPAPSPRHLPPSVQPEPPGFKGEKHGQRMPGVQSCLGRCLPAWERSPGTRSILDKRGGRSGAAQIRPNKGPTVTCGTKALLHLGNKDTSDKLTSWDSPSCSRATAFTANIKIIHFLPKTEPFCLSITRGVRPCAPPSATTSTGFEVRFHFVLHQEWPCSWEWFDG